MNHLYRLQQQLINHKIDAILITDIINVQWLTSFNGSFGYAIVTPEKALFVTDSRYALQSEKQVKGFEIEIFRRPQTALNIINDFLIQYKIKKICFDPNMSVNLWQEITRIFDPIELKANSRILIELRMIKNEDEIAKIKAACKLADDCMAHIVKMIQSQISEFEIHLEIEFYLRRHQAHLAFEPIVVSGINSAFPHGKASEKKLESGDFLTLDFGAYLNGYSSDLTRSFVIGHASEKHRKIYQVVLDAQEAAIQSLKPGISAQLPSKIAQEILDQHQLLPYFTHSLGHGLGCTVHDYGSLNPLSQDILKPGQVWTIEPGVYIENFGGIRIEDDVLITDNGYEILTNFPKSLRILP